MGPNERKILAELRKVVCQLEEGKKVAFDSAALPESSCEELNDLKKELEKLSNQYNENYDFILNLAGGNLKTKAPAGNNFANPYKQLQSDLLHLTWQIHQISQGDLDQKVFFSGDFSESMNRMTESLREKQRISEQNEAYLIELKELNAMKDKFFSIIAHDLKNPFSGLLTLSDLVLNNIQEKQYEHLEEYASMIRDFSNQGYKLLVNLLEWARLQTNSISIHIEPLSLSSVVEVAKSIVSPRAQQKHITLTCSCSHDYQVLADVNLLTTVMRNLLSNAVKFTRENGFVRIWGEETEQTVIVHVEDNGVGIRPENLTGLFRMDTNTSTPGTANEQGTGLGLILCQDFIEKMNGKMTVVSEEGKGSTFSFHLPKAPAGSRVSR